MKIFTIFLNLFAVLAAGAALSLGRPVNIQTKALLLFLFITLPPLDLKVFFHGKPGKFSQVFFTWFKLACPTEKEKAQTRDKP